MKRATKYGLIVVAVVGIGAWVVYQRVDKPPQQLTASVADGDKHKASPRSCIKSRPFTAAYQVRAAVESSLESRMIYQSQLNFRIQLQQAIGDRVFGVATDIIVREATIGQDFSELRPVENVLFLANAKTSEHTVISEFDNLGLMKQHPMAILSQLLKNLSVGDGDKSYRFTYDPLQREYRYRVADDVSGGVRRDLLASNATPASSKQLQPQWEAVLDERCLPKSLQVEEVLPIASAGQAGFVRFVTRAKRIDDYMDLSRLDYTAQANRRNRWEVAALNAAEITPEVTSEEEMWEIFSNFQQTKNAARLARAAEYMMENLPLEALADKLTNGVMADEEIRDMVFGLGLTSREETEDYMLGLLTHLPANDGEGTDLQKIRLMVAISGNDRVTDKSYNTLAAMADDVVESPNVRRNALINMGSMVSQMQRQGQDTSAVSNSLDTEIIRHMEDEASSSAIFSAGNAGLENLSDEVTNAIVEKLHAGNQKERYAAARVLSGNSRHHDILIDHLAGESSVLVSTTIVSALRKDQLSGGQRARLLEVGMSAPEQVRHAIDELLGR